MKTPLLKLINENVTKRVGQTVTLTIRQDSLDELVELERRMILDARQDGFDSTFRGCESDCGSKMYLDGSNASYYDDLISK